MRTILKRLSRALNSVFGYKVVTKTIYGVMWNRTDIIFDDDPHHQIYRLLSKGGFEVTTGDPIYTSHGVMIEIYVPPAKVAEVNAAFISERNKMPDFDKLTLQRWGKHRAL